MRLPKRCALLLVATLLAGCVERWQKPGGTAAEFDATRTACSVRAQTMFPPLIRTTLVQPGYYAPSQTNCTGSGPQRRCTTTGGHWVPPSYASVDDNQNARRQQVRSCLFTAGWRPVEDDDPPPQASAAAPAPEGGKPAVAQPAAAARGNPSFNLVNAADRPVASLFASPSSEPNWGQNRLGAGPVPPGATAPIRLPEGPCLYDIRAEWAGGRSREWREVDACAITNHEAR
jgi:hypothetical protein